MAPRLRRMQGYRPRPRKAKLLIPKQMLLDLHRRISAEVGALILCIEQREIPRVSALQLQLRSDFQKHKDEMTKAAEILGTSTVHAVRQFLNTVDKLLHTQPELIDPATVHDCYTTREELEKLLQAA